MRRQIAVAVVLHAGITAVLLGLVPDQAPATSLVDVAGLAGAFALIGLVPLHLGFRRSACTVVLTEAVLVIALFTTGPVGVVAATAIGEVLGCIAYRQRPLKAAFNTAQNTAAAAVAATVFFNLWPDPTETLAISGWVAAGVAAGCFAFVNIISTSWAVALAERTQHPEARNRLFDQALLTTLPIYAFTTSASAALGIIVVALFTLHVVAPVLVVPLLAMTVFESQSLAAHRAERLRFERLYAASTRTSRLAEFDAALASHASEARELVTGAVGVCCAPTSDGTWRGVVVDDRGPRPAAPELIEELVALDGQGVDRVDVAHLPPAIRAVLPSAIDLALAAAGHEATTPVILAVLREIAGDEHPEARAEVLSAFAGHAALGVANARLYQEIDAAYRHQVDLNRQKAEFVAAVSHELRTPLTTTIGAVQTVHRLGDRLGTADRDQLLGDAITQGQRLRVLIDDLLLVAAAEHRSMGVDLHPLELETFLRSVSTTFAGADRDRISTRTSVDTVVCDEHKLHRVVVNLVENAVKYAPEGPIEVEASGDEPGWLEITVADRGPGIPPSERERVFERFVQLDQSSTRTRGGTGLGLHLCRQLAGLLGGSLDTGDRPGGGAVFTLRLPADDAARAERATAAEPSAPEPSAPGPSVAGPSVAGPSVAGPSPDGRRDPSAVRT